MSNGKWKKENVGRTAFRGCSFCGVLYVVGAARKRRPLRGNASEFYLSSRFTEALAVTVVLPRTAHGFFVRALFDHCALDLDKRVSS